MSEQEARATALTKEFEDDIVAIEQDEDNDETARDILKQERRTAFYKSMMDLQKNLSLRSLLPPLPSLLLPL
jgi:hypothetical protein